MSHECIRNGLDSARVSRVCVRLLVAALLRRHRLRWTLDVCLFGRDEASNVALPYGNECHCVRKFVLFGCNRFSFILILFRNIPICS